MSAESNLSLAVRYNNEAINHMEGANVAAAVRALTAAIKLTKHSILLRQGSSNKKKTHHKTRKHPPCNTNNYFHQSLNTGQDPVFAAPIKIVWKPAGQRSDHEGELAASDLFTSTKGWYIMKYFAKISEDEVLEGCCCDASTYTYVSGIMILNLALIYLLQAISSHTHWRARNMLKARRFYEIAYRLQVSTVYIFDITTSMLMMNNIAVVLDLMNGDSEATPFWSRLLSLIIVASQPRSLNSMPDHVAREVFQGYVENASHILLKNYISSPAA